MKRAAAALLCVMLIGTTVGCGGEYGREEEFEDELEEVDMDSLEELYHIRITAGDTVLSGVLYDTQTSRAFDLPEHIPRYAKAGYAYELGSLAYWYEGPSIALIYKASRDQTVVPVVPIGKVTSDVSVFEEYGGIITIELDELSDMEPEEE